MICNAYFKDKDMHKGLKQYNNLKTVAASTTLPFKQITLPSDSVKTNLCTYQMVNNLTIEKNANERNNLLKMQSSNVIHESTNQSINDSRIIKIVPITKSQLNKVVLTPTTYKTASSKSNIAIPKTINTNTRIIKKVSNVNAIKKVPVLKITINKKYNKPPVSNLNINKHAIDVASNIDTHETKKGSTNEDIKPDVKDYMQNIDATPKPVILDLVPIKNTYVKVETSNTYTPKIAYARKGDLSRDNSRCQTSAEKVRYLYTKAQRDCDILRIRLRALKERQKQEKLEVRKLQLHLGDFCKDVTKESVNEKSERYAKRKTTSLSLGDTEEDECEKLLRKVRKIQQDILNPNHSATASNKKLERTSMKNKITRVYGRRKTNNLPEITIVKKEVVSEVCNNSTDVVEDFHVKSNSDIKSEDYVEPAIDT